MTDTNKDESESEFEEFTIDVYDGTDKKGNRKTTPMKFKIWESPLNKRKNK